MKIGCKKNERNATNVMKKQYICIYACLYLKRRKVTLELLRKKRHLTLCLVLIETTTFGLSDRQGARDVTGMMHPGCVEGVYYAFAHSWCVRTAWASSLQVIG